MNKKSVLSLNKFLFFMALGIYIFFTLLQSTMLYTYVTGLPFSTVVLLLLELLLILNSMSSPIFNLRSFLLYAVTIIASILIFAFTPYRVPVIVLLFMMDARGINFDEILKVYVTIVIPVILVILIATSVGVLENVTYVSGVYGYTRNSLGFIYPTDFVAHVFFASSALVYLKRGQRFSWLFFIFILGIAYATYLLCHTRLDSFCIVLVDLAYLISHRRKKERKMCKLRGFLLTMFPLFCCLLSIYMNVAYDPSNSSWYALNVLLSNRLYYGRQAISEYGFTLFGQTILMNGHSVVSANNTSANFYIDCSYINIGLRYGVVFLAVVIIMCCYMMYRGQKENNRTLCYVLFICFINSIIAQHMVEVAYDIFIISALTDISTMARTEKMVSYKQGIISLHLKSRYLQEKEHYVDM